MSTKRVYVDGNDVVIRIPVDCYENAEIRTVLDLATYLVSPEGDYFLSSDLAALADQGRINSES